jgi:antitoxin FitA
MGQILVRNLDDSTIERLKLRAARSKSSLEQTVRDILTEATKSSKAELLDEIDRIRAMSKPSDVDSVSLIRVFRDGDDPDR